MTEQLPQKVNLCLAHVAGNPFTLGLLDPMLQVGEALAALGVEVTAGRNRLRRDAVNWVFGGFRGFDPGLARSYECVIVNLEQLGTGGGPTGADYQRLLEENAVVDYHPDNPPAYGKTLDEVPLLTFGHSPRLAAGVPTPLAERPVDLLFLGLPGERRAAVLRKIRAAGVEVVAPDGPVFGPERDELVRSAKAVVNIAAYELNRFEQVRASLCLSLGTPVVSERRTLTTDAEKVFEHHVSWFDAQNPGDFFRKVFKSRSWFADAEEQVASFTSVSTVPSVSAALSVLARRPRPQLAPTPASRRVVIGTGTGYRAGWLNVGDADSPGADVVVSCWSQLRPGLSIDTVAHGRVHLGSADEVVVAPGPGGLALEHLDAALRVLADGGTATVVVPLGASVAAAEEHMSRFWARGLAASRFELVRADPVDMNGQPCPEASAIHLSVVLRKLRCSPEQTTSSRTFLDDLGGLLPQPPAPLQLTPLTTGVPR